MELGIIRQINIDTEMQTSYLDYAMSVIVARALPDVRDGLKPVQRRILYAMHDLGLLPDRPYKKSARIVGEVLGKYHPHGDVAVYEAMVRMAQDFSLRYPLVDGQGNFGSIDGDNAAAMRYTEARLARIATEMLADIEKDTVDWTDNFDGTLREPTVLPAMLPNLLVNGASGIAVGMSTNIPPHNLGEVCDALCYLIDHYDRHDDITVEDLMQFIPGPDFPTGGVVYRYAQEGNGDAATQTDVIAHAYAGGKGSIVMQAKAHIEDMSRNRSRIVVTELPYMANKTNLLERIAELVRDGRLEGITDLRDESDRTGMRICIEMTRTVEPRQVLADLFKLTPLQTTFGVSLLALVDGEPRLLSLKRMLLYYVEHRQVVITRRSQHDLEKARQRAHILEGLLRALDVLDEVIALIRKSRTADTARQNLIEQFKFTELQAQAILDMQLRRLAALERRKLQDEYRETVALIRELEALLASPKKILALIKQNLLDLKSRFGDARRTQIADRVKGTLTAKDVLPDEDVWVTLNADGSLARQRRLAGREWGSVRKTGKGAALILPFPVSPMYCMAANTRHDLYLFSAKGQATRIHAHQISEAPGSHYADLSGLTRRDRIVAILSFPHDLEPSPSTCLLLVTVQGKVKRVALAELFGSAQADPTVIGLDDGDELLWAGVSPGDGEFMLVAANGQAIRFAEDGVRAMGLPAGGIGGIKLAAKDRVIAAVCVPGSLANEWASDLPRPTHLALVTAAGYGKRVPVADFPAQGRNGQGVVAAKLSDKTGEIAGAALVSEGDVLVCSYAKAAARQVLAAELPEMGRPAQGKPVPTLMVSEPVTDVTAVAVLEPARGPGVEGQPAAEPEPAAPATRSRRSTARTTAAKGTTRRTTAQSQPSAATATSSGAGTTVKPARTRTSRAKAVAPEATTSEPAAPAAGTKRRSAKTSASETATVVPGPSAEPAAKPARTRTSRAKSAASTSTAAGPATPEPATSTKRRSAKTSAAETAPAAKPTRTSRSSRAAAEAGPAEQLSLIPPAPAPKKKGCAAADSAEESVRSIRQAGVVSQAGTSADKSSARRRKP